MSESERKCTPGSLTEDQLERVAGGGLTPSQLDPRKDGVQALIPRMEGIDKPQAYLFWTHWVPHVPRG
jgi:hypothetical protein